MACKQEKFISHSSRGQKSKIRCKYGGVLVRTFFQVVDSQLLCPHMVEGVRELSGVSL